MKTLFRGLTALAVLFATSSFAAVGTLYVDTGGVGTNSGSTDTNSPTASGSAAAWATGTTAVTLDTNTNLVGVAQDGSQSILLGNATNTNQHVFWIASFTGCTGTGACVVTTTGAPASPTCSTCTGSAWAVGGRYLMPSGTEIISGSLRAGDTLIFNNNPATRTSSFVAAGSSGNSTLGTINVIGKSGVRPTLTISNTANVLSLGGSITDWRIENLELVQNGGSGAAIAISGQGVIINNIKVSKAGGNCVEGFGTAIVVNSELTGCGGDGLNSATAISSAIGNYIHGNTGNGITNSGSGAGSTIINNLITGNTGRGIYMSGATGVDAGRQTDIVGNTIYGNTNTGLEVTDQDTTVYLYNNIIQQNGGTTYYNVLWSAGNAQNVSNHSYNLFYSSSCLGGAASACVSNLTPNSTEVSSDALFTNAGGGNFSITSASPAKNAGYPGNFIAGTTTSYRAIGAAQPQGTSGGNIIGGGL